MFRKIAFALALILSTPAWAGGPWTRYDGVDKLTGAPWAEVVLGSQSGLSLHLYCSPSKGRQSFIIRTNGFHVADATVGMRIDNGAPFYLRLNPVAADPQNVISRDRALVTELLSRVRSASSIFVRVESEYAPREEGDFQPEKQSVLAQFKNDCGF